MASSRRRKKKPEFRCPECWQQIPDIDEAIELSEEQLKGHQPPVHACNWLLSGHYCGNDCLLDAWSRGYPQGIEFELARTLDVSQDTADLLYRQGLL